MCDAGSFASHLEIVAALVRRVTVAQNQVTIEIDRKALAERLLDQEAALTSRGERTVGRSRSRCRSGFGGEASKPSSLFLIGNRAASEPDANLVQSSHTRS